MELQGPGVGNLTDEPERVREPVRQTNKTRQLSPPQANQTHRAEARRAQSISTARNEKHIFPLPVER